MTSPLHRFGGRRFVLALGCGFVTSLLTAIGVIGETTYATVVIATVGAYIGGNVVESVKNGHHDGH